MSAPDLLRLLAERDVHLTVSVDGRLEIDAPTDALEAEELAFLREHRAEIIDGLLADPAAHCPACGSPSWWRSPSSPTWRCSYCEPRDRSRAEAFESVTLASGQWAPGTRPPIPEPVTVDGLLAIHGETVAGCRTLDVLEQADDTDLPELHDRVLLEAFAVALVADHQVRPLPAASLPLLHRLALEIGDDVGELREYLDRSTVGRALRVRLEREHGAVDRCLLALRADPDGPLLLLLARTLDGNPGARA